MYKRPDHHEYEYHFLALDVKGRLIFSSELIFLFGSKSIQVLFLLVIEVGED